MVNKERKMKRMKERRIEINQWFKEYKKKLKCEICGESDSVCLDFHHIKEKNYGIAFMISKGYGIDSVLKEIKLCCCLCSNCHRKVHNGLNIEPLIKNQ